MVITGAKIVVETLIEQGCDTVFGYPGGQVIDLYDDLAKQIPVQVKKSNYTSRWGSQTTKKNDFNNQYPLVSKGNLYVNRFRR